MLQPLQDFFGLAQFVPRGESLLWRPGLLVTHGLSDLLSALACFAIPLVILKVHKLRPDLVDPKVARLFASFIALWGLSHLASLATLWVPVYGVEGVLKLVAAVVSVFAAVQLIRLLPSYLHIPSQGEMARKDAEIMRRQFEAEEARSAQEKLNEFAYIVSHDLRAPLRGISNQITFLVEDHGDELGADQIHRLSRITELCQKADSLIVTLLKYSRIGRTQARESVSTQRVVEEVIASLKEFLGERNGAVEIETDLPKIAASPADVDTLFRNLILNGLTYNDAERPMVGIGFLAQARIDGRTEQNVFYVRDNGIGIEPEFREEAFRMFKRLNHPERYGEGSGAGLAFVRKVVEADGGWVRLVSTPGQGSTFYISLAQPAVLSHRTCEPHEEAIQVA